MTTFEAMEKYEKVNKKNVIIAEVALVCLGVSLIFNCRQYIEHKQYKEKAATKYECLHAEYVNQQTDLDRALELVVRMQDTCKDYQELCDEYEEISYFLLDYVKEVRENEK